MESGDSQAFERKLDAKLVMSVAATGLMSFSGVVIETAMNVTFPALMTEFSVDTSTVQWMTTGYLLVLACIIPASSFLKRRFPTKTLFACAISLFIVGVIVCATASSFAILLCGRLIQGVGTGIALPLMFNIVLEQSPFDRMGSMMGIASLITAAAPAVGPSLGGVIVQNLGWRMIFVALLPILGIAFVMGMYSLRQSSELGRSRFDWHGWALLVVSFVCFVLSVTRAGSTGWLSTDVALLALAFLAGLALFVRHSRTHESPVIRTSIFKNRGFCLSVLSIVLLQLTTLGLGYLIPNFSQLVNGEGPAVAGSLLLPGCIVGAILAPVGGRILDRFGARPPILLGNALIVLSTLLFAIAGQNLVTPLFLGFYLVFGFGQGLSVGNMMTNGLSCLPHDMSPDGNAAINTVQQLAGAAGTAVASSIVAASQASIVSDFALATAVGTQSALWTLFGATCLMALFQVICLRSS